MRERARAQVQCVENVGKLLSWSKYSYRFPKDAAHANGAKISTCSSSNRSIYLAAAADDRAMWRSSIVLPQLLATLSSAARRSECCIFIYIYTYTLAYDAVINQIFMRAHQQQVKSTSNKTCPQESQSPMHPISPIHDRRWQALMINQRPQKAKGIGAR